MFGKTPSSEISRLVLGYLVDAKCLQTASTFLEECNHFKSCKLQLQQYITSKSDISSFDMNVFGETLLTIVNEYSEIKARMNKTSFSLDPIQQVIKQNFPTTTTPYQHLGNEVPRVNLLPNQQIPVCDTLFTLPEFDQQPASSSHRDGKKSRGRKLKTPKRIPNVIKDNILTETEFHDQINSSVEKGGAGAVGLKFSTPSQQQQQQPIININEDDEGSPTDITSNKKSSRINLRSLSVSTQKLTSIQIPCVTPHTRDDDASTPSNGNVNNASTPSSDNVNNSSTPSSDNVKNSSTPSSAGVKNFTNGNISGFLFASATVSSPCEANKQQQQVSIPLTNRNTLPSNITSPSLYNKKVTRESSPSTSLLPQVIDKSAIQPVDTQLKDTQLKDTQLKDTQLKDTQLKDTQLKDALSLVNAVEIQETDGDMSQETMAKKPSEIESPNQNISTVELDELDEESLMSTSVSTESSMSTEQSTSTESCTSTEKSPALAVSKRYEMRKRTKLFDTKSPSRKSLRSSSKSPLKLRGTSVKIVRETSEMRALRCRQLKKDEGLSTVLPTPRGDIVATRSSTPRRSGRLTTPRSSGRTTRYSSGKSPVVIKVTSSPRSKRLLDYVTVSVDPAVSDKDAVLQLVKKIKITDQLKTKK